MVELTDVRQWHAHVAYRRRPIRQIQGRWRRVRRGTANAQQDGFDVEAARATAGLDRTLHQFRRMIVQQLQDAGVVLDPARRPVLPLQRPAQLLEDGGQLPVAKDVGVVQGGRPALERVQVMPRVEDLLVPAVGARVRGDHAAGLDHVEAVDVGLDRDGLEGSRARHAVAVTVVADRLILVRLGRLHDARIEGVVGQ